MTVRRTPKNCFVTTSAAALNRLAGRPVTSRVVLAALGTTIELTRHRGGCWRISGAERAIEAVKLKLQRFNISTAREKECKVVRVPHLPEVLSTEEYHGRTLVVTRHYTARGDRFVAHAPSWGTFSASTTTGTDPTEVLDRLKAGLPVVVRETTFRGRSIEVIRVSRKGREEYHAEGGGVRRRGKTAREAEKALVQALGGGKVPRATYHEAPRSGVGPGGWVEGDIAHNPFAGLKG